MVWDILEVFFWNKLKVAWNRHYTIHWSRLTDTG